MSCLGDRFMEWNAKVEGKDSVFHLGFLFLVVMFLIVWTGLFYFCFGHVVVTFRLLYSYCYREHIYNLRWILKHLLPDNLGPG